MYSISMYLQMGFDCGLSTINTGTLQRFVLGPLILIIFKQPYQAIKFRQVCHFADDTNQVYLSNSINKLIKLVNTDLKHLVNWFNANKM